MTINIPAELPVNVWPKLGAVLTGIGGIMQASGPSHNWQFAGMLCQNIGMTLVGFTCRQWNKSTEDNTPSTPGAGSTSVKLAVLLALVLSFSLVNGCMHCNIYVLSSRIATATSSGTNGVTTAIDSPTGGATTVPSVGVAAGDAAISNAVRAAIAVVTKGASELPAQFVPIMIGTNQYGYIIPTAEAITNGAPLPQGGAK